MTTLGETTVPDDARCKCSGSNSPRSTYSQEIIFSISLVGRVGIPGIVVFEQVVFGPVLDGCETTVVVLVLARVKEDAGKEDRTCGPEGVAADVKVGRWRAETMKEAGGESRETE